MGQSDCFWALHVEFLALHVRGSEHHHLLEHEADIAKGLAEATPEQKQDDGNQPAKNTADHKNSKPVAGTDDRSDRAHELHITCAHAAEEIEREIDQEREAKA